MLIAFATDLSGDDHNAFVHATGLAAAGGAQLVSIHGNPQHATAADLPDAAALAARWGRTISHERRCHECCDDVADTVLDAMRALRPDLAVVGTHARHGLSAFLRGSVGEALARNLDVPVLVVPNTARGFVDAATGAIDLRRIVIPAGTRDDAQHGGDAARALLELAGARDAELEVVHVDDHKDRLEDAILAHARAHRACVLVMTTHGHDGLGDVVLGSHTERVIREAPCPVLSVVLERRHA